MVANLASFVEEKANLMLPETDLSEFMKLLFEITSHNSLAVSIPVLNVWTRIVKKDILSEHEAVLPLIPGLLELVTSRLMRVSSPFKIACIWPISKLN
jgi:exportin-5